MKNMKNMKMSSTEIAKLDGQSIGKIFATNITANLLKMFSRKDFDTLFELTGSDKPPRRYTKGDCCRCLVSRSQTMLNNGTLVLR